MAYVWTTSVGKQDEGIGILKAGMEANPARYDPVNWCEPGLTLLISFLLNFAYAEHQEAKKEYTEVHATYEKFLSVLRIDLEAREKRIQSANSSFETNVSGATAVSSTTSAIPATTDVGGNSASSSFATQISEGKPLKSKELTDRQTEYGLVWIMYVRFSMRAEGVKASRSIFAKALANSRLRA